ncbi:MAG: tetratricopeptide repeat protein [Proteobacteria bacterium]|nr:tetratricopeptide repeat protein [Pseudomonadota bacterium]MBU1689003.1 tetratricopeptide repeat protein [Pseudomonadota bacterium]
MDVVTRKIADLIERSIGLTVASMGAATLKRAVNNRKRALDITDDEAYLQKITVSFMELRNLVEEVVIPETWFFRDQEPFNYLAEYIHKSPKDCSVDIFRILSLPCSTGEEPYSIAMTLLQAGLKSTSFFIDAVDVSSRSLAVATTGVYGQNSFRTKDLQFRDNFFHKTEKGYSLNPLVRGKVRFVRGNILEPGFLDGMGRYDVVFCRNLLIYFDKVAQAQVINSLYELLVADGILFSGHSEAGLFLGGRFAPISHSRAFAFRKKEREEDFLATGPGKGKFFRTTTTSDLKTAPFFRRESHGSASTLFAPKPKELDEFANAQKMADAGNLDDATRLCEKCLRQSGPSAKWYHLLGVIHDSQGRADEALKFFRKAVYLDPSNAESLIQLSLLAERAGNIDSAENYKQRARRIQEKG